MARDKKAPPKRMSNFIAWVCAVVSAGIALYFGWSYGLEPYLVRRDEQRAVTEVTAHWSAPAATAKPQITQAPSAEPTQPLQGDPAFPLGDGDRVSGGKSARLSEQEAAPRGGTEASPQQAPAELPLGETVADYHQDYDEQELSGAVPMALVRVPRWGDEYQAAVVNSVENEALHQAVGHYAFSAMPGECGNCVMAAHRSNRGGLFRRIKEFQPGDEVIVETQDWVFTYELYCEAELVEETKVDEIAAIPHHDGFTSYERYITLQACEIGYSHMRRLIVHGMLTSAVRKA